MVGLAKELEFQEQERSFAFASHIEGKVEELLAICEDDLDEVEGQDPLVVPRRLLLLLHSRAEGGSCGS